MLNELEKMSLFDALFGEEVRVNNEIELQGYAITEAPLWIFDKYALKTPPRKVYRFQTSKYRYYYYFLDELMTEPVFCISVTSSIASLELLPTSKYLIEWYAAFPSMDEAYKELKKRADYGTFTHILCAEFFRNGRVSFDNVGELARQFKIENNLEYNNGHWVKYANRDLIALEKWAREYEVKPLAIEIGLAGKDGYATFVDFICEMTIGSGANGKIYKKDLKEGKLERVNAIIDWKSFMKFEGEKSFYEPNQYQLEACRRLVKENFPTLRIDKLYNVSFHGSVHSAEVTMVDQTDTCNEIVQIGDTETTLFDTYWGIYKTKHPHYRYPSDIELVTGDAILGSPGDTYKIGGKSPREIVINKHRGQNFKESL